jgi:kumamolisin
MRFPRPGWQNVKIKSVNPNSIDGRVVPDVCALAGDPLYDLVFTAKRKPNGGTSASAPLWAALIARIDALLPQSKRQRFLTPLLYSNGPQGRPVGDLGMRDIREGNNTSFPKPGVGYRAGLGFDAVSGWGAPDGKALLNALTILDISDQDAAA